MNLKKKSNLLNDAAILTLSALVVKIFGVIYKVPLSYILGDEGMGYFNSAYTVYSCFYIICSAGIPRSISILTSQSIATRGERAGERVLSIALITFVCVGCICTAILMLFARRFSAWVGNSGAQLSIFVIGTSLVSISASGVMRGYLNGTGRQLPIAICESVEALTKLIVGLFFASYTKKCGLSLPEVAAAAISGISIGSILTSLSLATCIKFKNTPKNTRQSDALDIRARVLLKSILKISLPITVGSLIMSATGVIDLSLIMRRLSDIGLGEKEAVALYGNYTTLVVPFLGLCISLVSPVSTAALPTLSRLYNTSNVEFSKRAEEMFYLTGIIGAALSCGFMFFSEEILYLLFPKDAADVAAPLLSMLSPAFILAAGVISVNSTLEVRQRTYLSLLSLSIAAIIKTVVSYILIGNPYIGIAGAPIGTLCFYAVSFSISVGMLIYTAKTKVKILTPLILPTVIAVISAVITKQTVNLLFTTEINAFISIITGIIYISIYITVVYMFMYKKVWLLCTKTKAAFIKRVDKRRKNI